MKLKKRKRGLRKKEPNENVFNTIVLEAAVEMQQEFIGLKEILTLTVGRLRDQAEAPDEIEEASLWAEETIAELRGR